MKRNLFCLISGLALLSLPYGGFSQITTPQRDREISRTTFPFKSLLSAKNVKSWKSGETYKVPSEILLFGSDSLQSGIARPVYGSGGKLTGMHLNRQYAEPIVVSLSYNTLQQLTRIETRDSATGNIESFGVFTYETIPFFGQDSSVLKTALVKMWMGERVCTDSVIINYDIEQRTITVLSAHHWSDDSEPIRLNEKDIYFYDSRWDKIKIESYSFNNVSNEWSLETTKNIVYDNQHRPTEISDSYNTTTLTYTDGDNPQIVEERTSSGSRWRTTIKFNSDGNILEEKNERENGNAWNLYTHDIYAYNSNGWLISKLSEYSDTLRPKTQSQWEYDNDGNCILSVTIEYDRTTGSWRFAPYGESNFYYKNMQRSFEEDRMPPDAVMDLGIDAWHAFIHLMHIVASKMQISYAEYVNLDEIIHADFSVFPNPCKDKVTIQNIEPKDQILLLDMSGRTLHSGSSQHGETVLDLTRLPQGIYVLQLIRQGHTYSKKIVKQ